VRLRRTPLQTLLRPPPKALRRTPLHSAALRCSHSAALRSISMRQSPEVPSSINTMTRKMAWSSTDTVGLPRLRLLGHRARRPHAADALQRSQAPVRRRHTAHPRRTGSCLLACSTCVSLSAAPPHHLSHPDPAVTVPPCFVLPLLFIRQTAVACAVRRGCARLHVLPCSRRRQQLRSDRLTGTG
jgi:hypothetical protein